jgi:DNA-binding LytR/AlgR family response regulator
MNSQKPLITHNSLKKMAESLPPESFIRIHKSFIISLPNIQSINKTQVIYGEKRIPIGEGFRDTFFNQLNTTSINI